jgi:acyl carrier protein
MSSLEQVRGVLTSVLCLGERGAALTAETRLLGNLPELDSMAVVNLITSLEEQFGIIVDDDEISAEAFETLSNLARFVEQKMLRS